MKKKILSIACVLVSAITFAQIPTDGLVAHYPFSGNANDESSNSNNGVVNGATLTTDRFGNANSAYSFDGVDDWIDCGSSILGVTTSNSLTINAWIKVPTTLVSSTIIAKYENLNASNSNYALIYDVKNNRCRSIGRGTDFVETTSLVTEKWVMVTAIFAQGTDASKFYLGGVEMAKNTVT